MTIRTIAATLDINKRRWDLPFIEAIQGDFNSLKLRVTVIEDGKPVDLTDWTQTFFVALDNQHYVKDTTGIQADAGDLKSGHFDYVFVKEAFSVPGEMETARFILEDSAGTMLTGMPRFSYTVRADPAQGKVIAKTFDSDYEKFKDEIKELMQDSLDNSAKALEDSQHAIKNANQALQEVENGFSDANSRLADLENDINNQQNVKKVDTASWQKYPDTNENGLPLSFPITDFYDLFNNTGNRTAFDALNMTNKPPGGQYFDVDVFRRTKTTGHAFAVDMVSNVAYLISKTSKGWTDWSQLETTKGAQSKINKALTKGDKVTLALADGYTVGNDGGSWYQVAKIGDFKIVTIHAGASGKFDSGVYTTVNKDLIPEELLPPTNLRAGAAGMGARAGIFEINTNGQLKLAHNLTSSPTWLEGIITYIL